MKILYGLMLCGFCIYPMIICIRAILLYTQSSNWKVTEGVVKKCSVYTPERSFMFEKCVVELEYTYEVDGRQNWSSRVNFDGNRMYDEGKEFYEYYFRVGSIVKVIYNPENPRIAYLKRPDTMLFYIVILFVLFFILASILSFILI